MWFGIICNLIAHARFKNKLPAILKLGMQLAIEAQKNVSFHAPVVSQVILRILDHADADTAEILGAPEGYACFALMLDPLY